MKGLGVRVVSGAVLLALVLGALWLQGLPLMGLVALATGLAAHELYTMARHAGYAPLYSAGIALSLLLALRAYLGGDLLSARAQPGPGTAAEVMVLAFVLILALVQQGFGGARASAPVGHDAGAVIPEVAQRGWANLGITLGGALYTGGLLGYAPLLAALPASAGRAGGTAWLLMVLLGTAACDIGAYFVGSLLGRRKLIPHISPAKTWEGLAGGTLGSVVAAVALSSLLQITLLQAVALGLLICAAAVSGDLCESMIKRAADVKDSSRLIPGHGGILDRLDSILFVLLAVYWFVQVAL